MSFSDKRLAQEIAEINRQNRMPAWEAMLGLVAMCASTLAAGFYAHLHKWDVDGAAILITVGLVAAIALWGIVHWMFKNPTSFTATPEQRNDPKNVPL